MITAYRRERGNSKINLQRMELPETKKIKYKKGRDGKRAKIRSSVLKMLRMNILEQHLEHSNTSKVVE